MLSGHKFTNVFLGIMGDHLRDMYLYMYVQSSLVGCKD